MNLLTEGLQKQIPPLYAAERVEDPTVYCKFFTPWSLWSWYVLEYDGADTFFGWIKGLDAEPGYFSKSELEAVRGPGGLTIERDLSFEPCRLSEIRTRSGQKRAV